MSKNLFNTNTFQSKNVTNSNNIDNSVDIKNATIDTAVIENIVNDELQGKQDALTTGDGIDITNNQISFDGSISQNITTSASNSITAGTLNYIDGGVVTSVQTEIENKQDTIQDGDLSIAKTSGLQTALSGKQPTLSTGDNISILNNTISATNTEYTAATNGGLSLSGTEFSVDFSNTNATVEIPQSVHIEVNGTPQLLVEPASISSNDAEIEIRGARNQSTSSYVSRLLLSNYDSDIKTTQKMGEISGRVQYAGQNYGGLYFSHFSDGSTRGTGATMNYRGRWKFGNGFQDNYKVQIDGNAQIDGTLGITGFSNVRTAIEGKQNTIQDGDLSIAKTSGLQTALNNKQDTIQDGDLSIAKTLGLQTALNGKQATIQDGDLSIAKTSGLQTALNGKQATIQDGDLSIAKTSGLQTALNSKQATISVSNGIQILSNELSLTGNYDGAFDVTGNLSQGGADFLIWNDARGGVGTSSGRSLVHHNIGTAGSKATSVLRVNYNSDFEAGTRIDSITGIKTNPESSYDLKVNGNTDIGGVLSIGGYSNVKTALDGKLSTLSVSNGIQLSSNELSLTGSYTGTSYDITGDLTVSVDATISNDLVVTRDVNIGRNVDVDGNLLVTGTNKVLGVDDTGVGYIKLKNNGSGGVIQFNNADDKLDIQYTANNIMSIEPDKVRLYKNLIPDTAVLDIGSSSSRFQTGNFLIANLSSRVESQTYRATGTTPMLFQNSSGTTRMVLTDQGKLGIQDDTPGYDLTVNGDAGIVEGLTVGGAITAQSNINVTGSLVCNSDLDVKGNAYIKQGLILDAYNMGDTDFTNNTNDDTASATSLQNIYIKFAPSSTVVNDWVYLRNIGANNQGHLAFDFHDDTNDVRFSIRNVHSSGQATDVITEVFKVLSTGITANCPIYRTPQTIFYNFGRASVSNNTFGNGNYFNSTSSVRRLGDQPTSISSGTITFSVNGTYRIRVGANPVTDGYNDRLAFCVYLRIGSTDYFQNQNYNFFGWSYTRNSSDGAFGNISFEDYIYISSGTTMQVRHRLDYNNRSFDDTLSNTQMECYCNLQIERIAETNIY